MLSLADIASILQISGSGLPDGAISTLLTDSRKVVSPETALFFALTGPRRDGHIFIPDLYKAGVRYFVVEANPDKKKYPGAVFFQVKDVLDALQKIAARHRSRFSFPVIGITGSNGKTVVKEWLYQLLQPKYNIVRSPKSYNSQIGVPVSVWQMEPANNLALFEAGISRPHEMKKLGAIVQPDIGVLTHIGTAHSEGFKSEKQKLREKLLLFTHAKVVIYNGDHELTQSEIARQQLPSFSWGKGKHNSMRVIKTTTQGSSTFVKLRSNRSSFEIEIPFTDEASVENVLTCCAVLVYLKVDTAFIAQRVRTLQPVNMRLEFKKGINNCLIINDSYSADADSLSIALDFLKQQAKGLQKTVILSDFLQDGRDKISLYNDILEQLEKHGISRFIGIGEQMTGLMPGLIAKKNSPVHFSAWLTTKDFLRQWHGFEFREEAILIKGARIFAFEDIAAQLEQKAHQTILEINLDAISHNYRAFQQIIEPGTKMMVMVKAFAYGSGSSEIAGLLQYQKADYLGIAYADEGVELRRAGITLPIMVLNPEESAFEAITDYQLEPDLFSFDQLAAFDTHLGRAGIKNYPVHIEVETGMNRLGFNPAHIKKLGRLLKNNDRLRVQSVFSHLAASEDEVEDAFTLKQYDTLLKACDTLENLLGYPFLKHIANSSAILRFPGLQMDMVRLGIGLYGIAGKAYSKKIQPALTLKSTIAQIKHLKKGETVSYNRRGVLKKDSVIATVRIGYADGYPRRLGNGVGYMLVRNQKARVVGTVCMDMVMIDVTAVKNVKEGDEVLVFGNGLPLEKLADSIGTIPYEIMTGISQRVKRVYWSE